MVVPSSTVALVLWWKLQVMTPLDYGGKLLFSVLSESVEARCRCVATMLSEGTARLKLRSWPRTGEEALLIQPGTCCIMWATGFALTAYENTHSVAVEHGASAATVVSSTQSGPNFVICSSSTYTWHILGDDIMLLCSLWFSVRTIDGSKLSTFEPKAQNTIPLLYPIKVLLL